MYMCVHNTHVFYILYMYVYTQIMCPLLRRWRRVKKGLETEDGMREDLLKFLDKTHQDHNSITQLLNSRAGILPLETADRCDIVPLHFIDQGL